MNEVNYVSRHSHRLLCPVCMVSLRLVETAGIEVDYCEQCRGVWLDRGELDKMVRNAIMIRSLDLPDSDES